MSWATRSDLRSWGLRHDGEVLFTSLYDRLGPLPAPPEGRRLLAFANGRSYGDVCLNGGQALLGTRTLDRFIAFDAEAGVLECESGVLLSEILERIVPAGWFLPVLPGTRYVSVGGAIANDVHGKNHHGRGTFGCHVEAVELLRSDGTRRVCSAQSHADLFFATLGGLGLTGLIVSARLRLARVPSPWIAVRQQRFTSLAEFADLTQSAEATHEHVVAWLDTASPGVVRGILMQGNHAPHEAAWQPAGSPWRVPLMPPVSLVSRPVVRAFNEAFYRRVPAVGKDHLQTPDAFFFPLDGVRDWNRVYGRRGFYQYQCVVPQAGAHAVMESLLERIGASGECSFLAVLKRMGNRSSGGLLSFPIEGWTLALDFPDRGASTLALFESLDAMVAEAGGRLYPAKDARMSPAMFRRGYPDWERFAQFVDPGFSSAFWRRVTAA